MQIDGIPESISREAYLQLISSLGLDYDRLISLTFGPKAIKAEMYAINENGERYIDGVGSLRQPATHQISIPVLDDVEVIA